MKVNSRFILFLVGMLMLSAESSGLAATSSYPSHERSVERIQFSGRPSIAGSLRVGFEVEARVPDLTEVVGSERFLFQWLRCPSSVSGGFATGKCSPIPNATNQEYSLGPEDLGKSISVQVTAIDNAEPGQNTSVSNSMVIGPIAQFFSGLSFYSFERANVTEARRGESLYLFDPSWIGRTDVEFDVTWYICSKKVPKVPTRVPTFCSAVSNGEQVTEVSEQSLHGYEPSAAEIGRHLIGSLETVYSSVRFTAISKSVQIVPKFGTPANLTPPRFQGSPVAGQQLELVTSGTWSAGVSTPTAFQWFQCAKQVKSLSPKRPAKCVEIPHSTSETHPIYLSDVGKYLSLAVTLSNGDFERTFWTASTTKISSPAGDAQAPSFIEEPTFFGGSLKVGEGWYVNPGEWVEFGNMSSSAYFYTCDARPTSFEWTTFPDIAEPDKSLAPVGCQPVAHDRTTGGEWTGNPNELTYLGKYRVASFVVMNQFGIIASTVISEGPVTR